MTVTGGKTVTVIDLHHVAVSTLSASNGYPASGGGPHGLPGFSTQVDSGVDGWAAQKGIHAHAERRTHIDVADDGLADRHRDERPGIAIDLRAGVVDPVELTLEGAGPRLRWPHWDKWSTDSPIRRCAANINSEVS